MGFQCLQKQRSCGRIHSRTTTTLSSPKTNFISTHPDLFFMFSLWDSHPATRLRIMRIGRAPSAVVLFFILRSPPSLPLSYLHFVKFNSMAFLCLCILYSNTVTITCADIELSWINRLNRYQNTFRGYFKPRLPNRPSTVARASAHGGQAWTAANK